MSEKWEVVPVDDPSKAKPESGLPFHEWAIVGPELDEYKEWPRIPLKHKETGDLIVACVNAIRAGAEPLGMDPIEFARRLEGYPQIGVLLKCSTDMVPGIPGCPGFPPASGTCPHCGEEFKDKPIGEAFTCEKCGLAWRCVWDNGNPIVHRIRDFMLRKAEIPEAFKMEGIKFPSGTVKVDDEDKIIEITVEKPQEQIRERKENP